MKIEIINNASPRALALATVRAMRKIGINPKGYIPCDYAKCKSWMEDNLSLVANELIFMKSKKILPKEEFKRGNLFHLKG